MSSAQPKPRRALPEWPIAQLPGISTEDVDRLAECGIHTTRHLWLKTRSDRDRLDLAQALQVHLKHVAKWGALSDLARLPSVGCHYCGLLLHAGIASVGQLSQMSLSVLHPLILRVHVMLMQRRDLCPSVEVVRSWIEDAKAVQRH